MADPFLSEIRIMSFDFAPRGWALCNGQPLPINQNQGLFALLGTTFGGNGQTTFGLPDLRARTPIHVGAGHTLGERGGEQVHTLALTELPAHTHLLQASSAVATTGTPSGSVNLAESANYEAYRPLSDTTTLNAATIAIVGGGQAHQNMQPYLTLNFCIALQGIFPSPT